MEIGPYSSVQLDFEMMMMMIMQVTIGFQLNIHQWDIQLDPISNSSLNPIGMTCNGVTKTNPLLIHC